MRKQKLFSRCLFPEEDEGGPRPDRLWSLSVLGAGKILFIPWMHPAPPMFASIPCSHTPIQGACGSLRGPRPMHSFSGVCEKLLQTRYLTQFVVCAMMRQLASTHGFPWYAPTYWPYVVTTHWQSKQHPTNRGHNLTVTFRQGLYWLGYRWSSALLNCLILWNLGNIARFINLEIQVLVWSLKSSNVSWVSTWMRDRSSVAWMLLLILKDS